MICGCVNSECCHTYSVGHRGGSRAGKGGQGGWWGKGGPGGGTGAAERVRGKGLGRVRNRTVWMRNGTVAPAISMPNTFSAQDNFLLGYASLRWPRSETRQTWRVPNLMQTSTNTSKQLQMRRRRSGRRWKRLRQKVGGRHASGDSTAFGCKEIR